MSEMIKNPQNTLSSKFCSMEKRSAMIDEWKRGGQANLLAWENALGSMQRPRFGKRVPFDASEDDGTFYKYDNYFFDWKRLSKLKFFSEKRGRSLTEMENALSSLQRPR